jgi:AraC-like DNA-binding protein
MTARGPGRDEGAVVMDGVLRAMAELGLSPPAVAQAAKERGADGPAGLLEVAAEMAGEPALGIELGLRTPIHASTPLVYLMMSSATLGAAVDHMVRYAPVLYGRPTRMWLEREGDRTAILWGPGKSERQLGEYTAVLLLRLFRQLVADETLVPVEVRFVHAAPLDAGRQQAALGAPVRFGQPRNAIVMQAAQLALPSSHASPPLHALHEKVVAEALPPTVERPLLDRVRAALADQLEGGPPPLSAIARALATSTRTLQRRLAEQGIDYQQVVDDVRHARALALLADPAMSVLAVARAVGYGDASAFHRAFRRWTATTPAAWRDRGGGQR